MDVWTSSFLEHQLTVFSILASSWRWVLLFFDLLHHFAKIGRIHVIQRLHINFFIGAIVDYQRLQLSPVYVGFFLYQNRVIIFRLHGIFQLYFLAINSHLLWWFAHTGLGVGIIKAFFDLIKPAINAIVVFQPTAILMRARVILISPSEGTILREALHIGIRDEIGSDEVWLFEFIWNLADLAGGFHYAFVAVCVATGVQTHGVAHYHIADGANQVFGEVILLEGELSAVQGKGFHFAHLEDKGRYMRVLCLLGRFYMMQSIDLQICLVVSLIKGLQRKIKQKIKVIFRLFCSDTRQKSGPRQQPSHNGTFAPYTAPTPLPTERIQSQLKTHSTPSNSLPPSSKSPARSLTSSALQNKNASLVSPKPENHHTPDDAFSRFQQHRQTPDPSYPNCVSRDRRPNLHRFIHLPLIYILIEL